MVYQGCGYSILYAMRLEPRCQKNNEFVSKCKYVVILFYPTHLPKTSLTRSVRLTSLLQINQTICSDDLEVPGMPGPVESGHGFFLRGEHFLGPSRHSQSSVMAMTWVGML